MEFIPWFIVLDKAWKNTDNYLSFSTINQGLARQWHSKGGDWGWTISPGQQQNFIYLERGRMTSRAKNLLWWGKIHCGELAGQKSSGFQKKRMSKVYGQTPWLCH